jgi:nucleosome binding factor SPN SPT16 subunit
LREKTKQQKNSKKFQKHSKKEKITRNFIIDAAASCQLSFSTKKQKNSKKILNLDFTFKRIDFVSPTPHDHTQNTHAWPSGGEQNLSNIRFKSADFSFCCCLFVLIQKPKKDREKQKTKLFVYTCFVPSFALTYTSPLRFSNFFLCTEKKETPP